ncbi:MAG: cyanophycinase [Permianibacter sp.]
MKNAFTVVMTALLSVLALPAEAVKFYTTGNTANVNKSTSLGVCLAGGGSDDAWAGGWKYLLNKSGGGDIVVIRADGSRGGYESFIYDDDGNHGFPLVDSVTTIVIESATDANRSDVETAIRNAELVFFAGGDQWRYISWFNGSRLESAVEYLMLTKKAPVGGTSAGMALLGGIDFTARYDSPDPDKDLVDSDDVMYDPTGYFVDLNRSVVNPPFMTNVITDTHFSARNRFGRLVGFMARADYNWSDVSYSNIKAIAADEGTAACYDSSGIAKVFGTGKAFFLKGNKPIERIRSGYSLDWWGSRQAVKAYVITGSNGGSGSFNLGSWSGSGGLSEYWYVDGEVESDPFFGRN